MKKTLKLLFALMLALSNLLSWPGAVHAEGAKELNLSINTEPPTIDPGLATDSTSGAVIKNVFEGLTGLDPDGKVIEGVAESWDISEDGKVYTFKLRSDAKWSNGDPVKASDFEFAWKRVLNPETMSQYASILYPIEGAEAYNRGEGEADAVGVKALDDSTLEVKLVNATPYFLELTAFYTYKPVHQATVEANKDWAADAGEEYVTNGAFLLSEWAHNSHYTLEKNPEYWDADNVALDRVNVQIIESETTANNEYEAGNLDYLGAPYGTVALDYIDRYKESGDLDSNPYAAIYWYKVNVTDEVTGNKNIRLALANAIDRKGLVENITKGGQEPALGLVPSAVEGFEEDRGYMKDADFEKAKEYLAKGMEELGIDDPSAITVKISINDSEAHSAIAQYIQEGWTRELGINSEIDSTEWQVYLDRLTQLDYQVGRLGWIADFNDAVSFLDMYRTADTGNNDTGWENEEFKALIDKSATISDSAERLDVLKQAEALMMEEMPVIPLYYYTNNSVCKDHVKNMHPDPLGNINLKYVDVEAE